MMSIMLLSQDRGQEDVTTKYFYGLPFKANFADSVPGLAEINDMPGTDGFVMSVDPLFAVSFSFVRFF